jgi:inosose dehydratase
LRGEVLVVRPAPYAGQKATLSDDEIATIGRSWEAVGKAIGAHGIRLGLHFDFLSSLRSDDGLTRVLAATDPTLVGLALDTAEFVIAGLDPVSFVRSYAHRIVHVHLKNAATTDDEEEYLTPAAEYAVLRAGGTRAVPRWFLELGTEPLLVDAPGVVRALAESGYEGWIVVESDFTPHPASSAMLNGYEVQKVLAPLTVAHIAGSGWPLESEQATQVDHGHP